MRDETLITTTKGAETMRQIPKHIREELFAADMPQPEDVSDEIVERARAEQLLSAARSERAFAREKRQTVESRQIHLKTALEYETQAAAILAELEKGS